MSGFQLESCMVQLLRGEYKYLVLIILHYLKQAFCFIYNLESSPYSLTLPGFLYDIINFVHTVQTEVCASRNCKYNFILNGNLGSFRKCSTTFGKRRKE